MFRGPIEDRLAIRERFDSYGDAVTRQALDDYLDCWTDDGQRFGSGGECHGRDELRTHWHGIWKALAQMAFMTQIGAIESREQPRPHGPIVWKRCASTTARPVSSSEPTTTNCVASTGGYGDSVCAATECSSTTPTPKAVGCAACSSRTS